MTEEKIPAKPVKPCYACRSTEYWWRPAGFGGIGGWLCSRCHPDPRIDNVK